jgi:hypothetical protein
MRNWESHLFTFARWLHQTHSAESSHLYSIQEIVEMTTPLAGFSPAAMQITMRLIEDEFE